MMGSRVLIGGGTGFVGKKLCQVFGSNGYDVSVVSRKSLKNNFTWDDISKYGLPDKTHAVINVAGVNVLDVTKLWTKNFKEEIYTSRIGTTKTLAKAIKESKNKPVAFVTISGVGIYPPSEAKMYDEDSKVEDFDYFSKLCSNWESAANLNSKECRVVTVRSGVVLGREGGMIKNLYLPFSLGLGGPIGSGKQILPWIHIDDLTNLMLYCVENNVTGILNGVAPTPATNSEFTQAFAKSLSRPALIPTPKFVFNIVFGSERAKMVTQGQYVCPKRTLQTGFKFKYPDIQIACNSLVKT